MVLGGGSDSISEEVCNVKPFHELKLKGFLLFLKLKFFFQKEEKVSEFFQACTANNRSSHKIPSIALRHSS